MQGSPQVLTIELPSDLLAAIDRFVAEGKAASRNELMISSLRTQLTVLERSARDAEFRAMADDSAYQAEARQLLTEFASADREAWLITGDDPA